MRGGVPSSSEYTRGGVGEGTAPLVTWAGMTFALTNATGGSSGAGGDSAPRRPVVGSRNPSAPRGSRGYEVSTGAASGFGHLGVSARLIGRFPIGGQTAPSFRFSLFVCSALRAGSGANQAEEIPALKQRCHFEKEKPNCYHPPPPTQTH